MAQVTIKYVKKAKQWCKTTKLLGDNKKQQRFKQEWFDEKPIV